MSSSQRTLSFQEFWTEIGEGFLKAASKSILLFLPAVFLAVYVVLIWTCLDPSDPQRERACHVAINPSVWMEAFVEGLPRTLKLMAAGIPPILLGILYLEWDKYKKDKPHGFGVYGRRTAPNGGWMLSSFDRIVTGRAWEKYDNVHLNRISDSENHLCGNFSNLEVVAMVKAASRRFTSFLRKPTISEPECIEWHIHANSGEEVTLRFEQVAGKTQSWILTACLFEWSGRQQSARLVKRHVTRFFLSDNVATSGENPATST